VEVEGFVGIFGILIMEKKVYLKVERAEYVFTAEYDFIVKIRLKIIILKTW